MKVLWREGCKGRTVLDISSLPCFPAAAASASKTPFKEKELFANCGSIWHMGKGPWIGKQKVDMRSCCSRIRVAPGENVYFVMSHRM
jgi:hypothetical protein